MLRFTFEKKCVAQFYLHEKLTMIFQARMLKIQIADTDIDIIHKVGSGGGCAPPQKNFENLHVKLRIFVYSECKG